MGLAQNPTMRSEDSLEGMLADLVRGKSKLKAQKSASSKRQSTELRSKLDFSWATKIAQQWKHFISPSHVVSLNQESSNSLTPQITPAEVCVREKNHFEHKKATDGVMIKLKRELYEEILQFQNKSIGTETLSQLMKMKSKWEFKSPNTPKITVILNHFKKKTLCSQLDSLLHQTLPFHRFWVLAYGTPNEVSLKKILDSYNDSRISVISSSYDIKYYVRFQMALQTEADFVYILDDDMIPGRKMLQILSHKDFTFPSYTKFRSKEAGLYLPDPAYDITADRIVQVDYLSSSWFLSAELVKTLFIETPFTFTTGEDLHLSFLIVAINPKTPCSYQLQKYRNADSFVLPVDPKDKEKWGNSEHRLPYVSKTSVSYKNKVQVRDEQWSTVGKQAYIVVSGGIFCPCEDAATALNWPGSVCRERRFKIFDLGLGEISGFSNFEVPVVQAVYSSMRGLIKIHNPSVLIAVSDIDSNVMKALKMASESSTNGTTLVLLPRPSVSKVLWMADLQSTALPKWNKMHVSVNIVTQNRVHSLARLLKSLANAYYLGDEIPISFNMDTLVDEATLRLINSFNWPHGPKTITKENHPGRANPSHHLPRSLSIHPRLVEVVKENPKWNATEFFKQIHPNTPYLHQLPCSWGAVFFPKQWREFYVYMNMRFTVNTTQNPVQVPKSRTNGWQASWEKLLIDMMYLRGYVALYPNFSNQTSLSTNHMERGDHIAGKDNAVKHDKSDFEVPLLKDDFRKFLPGGKLPPASKLPSLNLFNQVVSLKEIKAVGAYLGEDVIECKSREIVVVDHRTGLPSRCASF
ncbi:glycosyltransferase family protein 2 [Actinidia rufa]|uniref:Glycosyltransferase family protein 2 n=1 Tax=Actinidia rufa TaxID=165716 RepID=A0A7J0H452_9ERIC|nr:glycosyltransferase family protein 2 [Actinidia rufa]